MASWPRYLDRPAERIRVLEDVLRLVEPAPGNLAFTSRAIRPHTDNPFAAARALRGTDPASFGTLTGTPAPFGYVDKETELRACRPPTGGGRSCSPSPGGS